MTRSVSRRGRGSPGTAPTAYLAFLLVAASASAEPTSDQARAATARTPSGPGADRGALSAATVGPKPSPQAITTPPSFSLHLEGDIELGGFVFQDQVPFVHNEGKSQYLNTAVGLNALTSLTLGTPYSLNGAANSAFGQGALQNTTAGYANTAIGARALYSNIAFGFNTAVGYRALFSNTDGSHNTALGVQALDANLNGSSNVAIGSSALDTNTAGSNNTAVGGSALTSNTEGNGNTAIGQGALAIGTTGSYNTAVGVGAGFGWYDGDHNIALGSGASGSASDSGTIRIGGEGNQTRTFIEGIRDAVSGHVSGFDQDVCINPSEQLGPCSVSSQRFKQDVRDLGDLHQELNRLRPVSFRYQSESAGEVEPLVRYGLIAEEVAEVFPSLITRDDQDKPRTVRYDLLTPLLVAEIQRQQKEIDQLKRLRAEVTALRQRLEQLGRELDKGGGST